MSEPKIVIGAGAAGLTAAAVCAERGGRVLLIEKMERPGRKLRITGKGRCNVTNATFDLQGLLEHIPTNPRFLYSAFSNFMPYDTIALLEDLGVSTKIERGERVFPVSDNATDIVDALVRRAKNAGVQFLQGTVERLELTEDGRRVQAVHLTDGRRLTCDSVAVCTGGCSYPATGSTGDGYTFARQCGHTIVPIRPALVPLVCDNNFIPELQGLSLRNVGLAVFEDRKKIYTDFGEMLFTHFGVSGPLVLSASAHMRHFGKKTYRLEIDLKPALDEQALDKRLLRDFEKYANHDFCNALDDLLPQKLIPVAVERSGIPPHQKVHDLTREQRRELVQGLKHFSVEIAGPCPVTDAIVTSGGIKISEIDPKTMESKLVKGLYFSGEIMDVDAYTGGFNLQIAWATGRAAGQAAAEALRQGEENA